MCMKPSIFTDVWLGVTVVPVVANNLVADIGKCDESLFDRARIKTPECLLYILDEFIDIRRKGLLGITPFQGTKKRQIQVIEVR